MRRETRDPRHMGRNPLPTILIVGDGHSEKRYFEDIRSYVNGYSLMPMVAERQALETSSKRSMGS